jgi:cytochrome c
MTKRIIIIFCLPILLSSRSGNAPNQEPLNDTSTVDNPASRKEADLSGAKASTIATSTDKGADLIVKNDCRNCHRESEKLISPAVQREDYRKIHTAIQIKSII